MYCIVRQIGTANYARSAIGIGLKIIDATSLIPYHIMTKHTTEIQINARTLFLCNFLVIARADAR